MGLLSRLGKWLGESRSVFFPGGHPGDPALAELWGFGNATLSGAVVTPDTAMRVTAVYACVKLLSNSCAVLPFQVYKRGASSAREIDTAHPLYPILHDRPNRWQTPFQFTQMMEGHVLLRGNSYAEIVSSGGAGVQELVPLHPDRVQPFWAPDGLPAYAYQPPTGPRRILLASEVHHLADLTLNDGLTGISPIRLHRETIGASMAARDYGAAFYGNSAQPRGGVEVPVVLDDAARKAFIEGWEQRQRGASNAGRMAVLEGGMKWVQIGLSNEDAQYLETMRFNKVDIASIYGVPPYLIGEHEKTSSWGTGLEQLNISFLTYSLSPWLVLREQAAERDLLTESGRQTHFLEHNVEGLLRGDFKTRMDGNAVGIQWGIYTINEVRRRENLPPVDGGDIRLQPLNMAPADQAMDVLLKQPAQQQKAVNAIRARMNGSTSPEALAGLAALDTYLAGQRASQA